MTVGYIRAGLQRRVCGRGVMGDTVSFRRSCARRENKEMMCVVLLLKGSLSGCEIMGNFLFNSSDIFT